MSKTYAITMLMIFNNRIKISGGRLDQEEEEECDFQVANVTSTLSRDQRPGRSRDGRNTKIFVSTGRLTFQLAEDPPSPKVENNASSPTSSESVRINSYRG